MATPFVTRLRELHAKAKAGRIEGVDKADYEQGRRELLRVALAAQTAAFGGQAQRESMRVALVLKVEITFTGGSPQSVTTVDIGPQGFSALLAFGAGTGAAAQFSIRVPGGVEAVAGKCRVAGVIKQGSLQRTSFAFEPLDAGARDRLEVTLFDFILQRLR